MTIEIKKKHRLRFDRWSRKYDRSILHRIVFNRSHNLFFRELLPHIRKDAKVLDVGCGTGKFVHKLWNVTKGIEIHGVDLSNEMIERARSKQGGESINFVVGDVENLPYESKTFDIVTCSNSFHHYPNQKKALSEMRRVLKDEGKLLIIDGSRDNLLGRLVFGIVQIVEGNVYHVFEKEMEEMLSSMGFVNITQRRFNPLAPLLFTMGHAAVEGIKIEEKVVEFRRKKTAKAGEATNE